MDSDLQAFTVCVRWFSCEDAHGDTVEYGEAGEATPDRVQAMAARGVAEAGERVSPDKPDEPTDTGAQ